MITPEQLAMLADKIEDERDHFLDILTHIATFKAAEDEVNHTVSTLRNASLEHRGLESCQIDTLVTYLPPNVVLFSYILYVTVPSMFFKQIFFRPSVKARDVTFTIHKELGRLLPIQAEFRRDSRRIFRDKYTNIADVIAFTGRCSNVFEIEEGIRNDQLLIYFGAGHNPFIVGQNANIGLAAQDAISIRMFNSGQDCLCPDVFFVHESVADGFLEELKSRLRILHFGELSDPNSDYSNLSYPDISEFCYEYFQNRADSILCGGYVDVLERYVEPTVLVDKIENLSAIPEFFAPVFNVYTYHNKEQLRAFINSEMYVPGTMAAMLYGASDLVKLFEPTHFICENETVFKLNNGNLPFGGYGICASHIAFNGQIEAKPVLISDAVKQYICGKE